MKILPREALEGRIDARISVAQVLGSESRSAIGDEIKTATFVIFGGGFFVARSSSLAESFGMNVCTVAVLTLRKIYGEDQSRKVGRMTKFQHTVALT